MKALLCIFSVLYGFGVGVRNLLFDLGILKSRRFDDFSHISVRRRGTADVPRADKKNLEHYFPRQPCVSLAKRT